MTGRAYDILMIADPRFAGGTSSALVADVEAFAALGARIGLLFVRSAFLREGVDHPNPTVMALPDLAGVSVVDGPAVAAETVFLHHPLVFFHGVEERTAVTAKRAALIAHQTPFRGDGSLEYDPLLTARSIRKAFGLRPLWAPISGVCRQQLESFAPLIKLTGEDWINVFEADDWSPERQIFAGPILTIGRHGRDDPLKWPETGARVAHALPAGPGRTIRVMGCPEDHLRRLGAPVDEWDIAAFGAEPVNRFLDSLDVFSYFHHPNWTETFGRTVAEAAMMGRVCIIEPSLAANFSDLAICEPADQVDAIVARLASAPEEARALGAKAREGALRRYSRTSVEGRWRRLGDDAGTRARTMEGASPPLRTARKLAGLYRRIAMTGRG
ncbi:MAG: glycosyltransferase family 1 protein [Pseudomonadota bacterium]